MEDNSTNVMRYMFGCGIPWLELKSCLEKLTPKDLALLGEIANRMQFSFLLRYQIFYTKNPALGPAWDLQVEWKDIPSLEVYLLFTCLDAFVGSKHKKFLDYLSKDVRKPSYSFEDIKAIHLDYENKFGLGSNLRSLFSSLPDSVKKWLITNIAVYNEKDPLALSTDETELVEELYRHYYVLRRIPFTHNALSKPLYMEKDLRIPLDNMWFMPYVGTKLKYKSGLDEATILRIILYTSVINKLGIPVTSELIVGYLRNLQRLNTFYSLLREVDANLINLKSWEEELVFSTSQQNILIEAGPELPSLEWVSKAIEIFDLRFPLEQGMRDWFVSYKKDNEVIINSIIGFLDSIPVEKRRVARNDYFVSLIALIQNLVLTQEYGRIIRAGDTSQIKNVWLIIRNPSYS